MGWETPDAIEDQWTLTNSNVGLFDGAVFDIDIFDGDLAFLVQDAPDPNWTRLN